MKTVLIGIQARSTSTRLPEKIHKNIGDKPMIKWVIDACQFAAKYLTQDLRNLNATIKIALLIPTGDRAALVYRPSIEVFEGDEHDVLSRYVAAANHFNADYICRVTSDCPFVPPHLISKHIKCALLKERDFTTNCLIRTFKEGFDIQVASKRLLLAMHAANLSKEDREHVFSAISLDKPFPFLDQDGEPNITHVLNFFDESKEKTSVDVKEELDRANLTVSSFNKARQKARVNGMFIT